MSQDHNKMTCSHANEVLIHLYEDRSLIEAWQLSLTVELNYLAEKINPATQVMEYANYNAAKAIVTIAA